jgi:flagellar biosynthesis chaperone FliJ
MLQERRALEARAEVQRAEARELDDIAGQLWQRRRAEVAS